MPVPERSAHLGVTRIPVRILSADPASTACSIAVSAPSSLISAQPNACGSGCPSIGRSVQVQLTTLPSGPTSTSSAGGAPVTGSYSNGGACTRPSDAFAPSIRRRASAVTNSPSVGPSDLV
jgi:hypothetical protein